MKVGTKAIKKEKVISKIKETNHEAGSGNLYIPILGDLFPKLWGQKMDDSVKYYLIINHIKYPIGEDLFHLVNENDFVNIHYSKYSNILLGIERFNEIIA